MNQVALVIGGATQVIDRINVTAGILGDALDQLLCKPLSVRHRFAALHPHRFGRYRADYQTKLMANAVVHAR